jgi:hypothetical protein
VVAVRDHDVAQPAPADGRQDRLQVRGIAGAGIDHELVAADDVGVRSLKVNGLGLLATSRTTPGASSLATP